MKLGLPAKQYHLVLNAINIYHDKHDFPAFFNTIIPIFKMYTELYFVLRGLRRFIKPEAKLLFDAQIRPHFKVIN